MKCDLCGDTIYDGEAVAGADEHMWCGVIRLAMNACTRAMQARREKGLPTPTSPYFVDPNRPVN